MLFIVGYNTLKTLEKKACYESLLIKKKIINCYYLRLI